ncbi:MAG: ABC transporter permease [Lentisphaerales bacterium]|nr:MAG: ABC transporter permease [Lentisphaerales bacterium]
MFAYIARRIAYAFPILLGVNLLLFFLFFFVNTPDDMARTYLGDKRVSREQIETWKTEHGYHLPKILNLDAAMPGCFTETIFWKKSMRLFAFDFGKSDIDGSRIGTEIRRRIPYSLYVTVPVFFIGLAISIFIAMIVAFYRGTYIDTWALVVCVIMMSISIMFYIVAGQYLVGIKLRLAPVSGFDTPLANALKFLVLPVVIGVIGGIGGSVRYYRTIFLEEINKDYIRTARAKGLGEGRVLFKHALKNAMFPILTNVVVSIPFLIIGSLLFENFFGIPGLGNYTIEAITKQDFAVVRSMVFLGAVLYVVALIGVDISYTLVDPRVRLK